MSKKIMKSVFYFMFASWIAILMFGCSVSDKKNELIVGLQSGYPPFEYVDDQGHVVGFDVDIAQEIATKMRKKLVIKEMGFDSLILALKSHKIDLIISGMSITQDRLKEINMVPYQGEKMTKLNLLFWNREGQSIESMKGKKVAVQSGTFQADFIKKHYPEIDITELENIQELVMNIRYGKSDAMFVDPVIGNELKTKYEELIAVEVPLLPEQQVMGNGIGIAKDQVELNDLVQKIVGELQTNHQIEKLYQEWFHGN